jgi:hypothetical protein
MIKNSGRLVLKKNGPVDLAVTFIPSFTYSFFEIWSTTTFRKQAMGIRIVPIECKTKFHGGFQGE